jgi:hypothetical protein
VAVPALPVGTSTETAAIVLLCLVIYRIIDHFLPRNKRNGAETPTFQDHGIKLAKLEVLFDGITTSVNEIKDDIKDIRIMLSNLK